MISLRKSEEIFEKGDFNLINVSKDFFIYKREYLETELYLVSNLSDNSQDLDFNFSGELILSNYDNVSNRYNPYETRIFLHKKSSI